MIELSSTQSLRVSLDSLRNGSGGLDAHRQSLLNRVPESGTWARFPYEHLSMKDLAYLTAKTGHEFAILRGKNEDILFHGDAQHCSFDDTLTILLTEKHFWIFGHSHPGGLNPVPSSTDRQTLEILNQSSSKLISGITGHEITYTANLFDDIFL